MELGGKLIVARVPFWIPLTIFSNGIAIYFYFHPNFDKAVATKFCTCHEAAKFLAIIMTGIAVKLIFYPLWIFMERALSPESSLFWVMAYCLFGTKPWHEPTKTYSRNPL